MGRNYFNYFRSIWRFFLFSEVYEYVREFHIGPHRVTLGNKLFQLFLLNVGDLPFFSIYEYVGNMR